MHTAFLHSIKRFDYRIEMKFDEDRLVVEKNSYMTKIADVYIAYDLDAWPRNPTSNFKFNNLEQLK